MQILKTNKKAAISDLFLFMIAGFIMLLISAALILSFGIVTTNLTGITTVTGQPNISEAAAITFGNINVALQQLRWWTFALIIAFAISIFLSNFLIRINPVFFIFHIMITIIAVVVAIIISNAYETIYTSSNIFGEQLQTFVGTSWMMLNMPIIITVIGVLGGVFQFIGITRDREQGGGFV